MNLIKSRSFIVTSLSYILDKDYDKEIISEMLYISLYKYLSRHFPTKKDKPQSFYFIQYHLYGPVKTG